MAKDCQDPKLSGRILQFNVLCSLLVTTCYSQSQNWLIFRHFTSTSKWVEAQFQLTSQEVPFGKSRSVGQRPDQLRPFCISTSFVWQGLSLKLKKKLKLTHLTLQLVTTIRRCQQQSAPTWAPAWYPPAATAWLETISAIVFGWTYLLHRITEHLSCGTCFERASQRGANLQVHVSFKEKSFIYHSLTLQSLAKTFSYSRFNCFGSTTIYLLFFVCFFSFSSFSRRTSLSRHFSVETPTWNKQTKNKQQTCLLELP